MIGRVRKNVVFNGGKLNFLFAPEHSVADGVDGKLVKLAIGSHHRTGSP